MKNQITRKDFCCDEMCSHLKGDEHGCEIQLKYTPSIRNYAIPYKPRRGGGLQDIRFCPWCGTKLPKDLNDKMMEVLKEEYNIDTYNIKTLPEEFRTDAWWKKRGL